MRKKQLALEVIERLKKNIQTQIVHLITMKPGNYLSVFVWLRSVQMNE